ncbi:fungal-specific transcription factor domain-containing protein [Penicillium paradoxum]|uniref:fungal-specific transcription factor domain-containing protein n=1 Tax=Penicillium paradoxum TaxID=176176 RepID=UPI0025498C5D|nr:fungal-specific transcription factor domain-containing protein [Penicillium paradoxum]KAJ5793517.1 fungal-specific transcription factor domain-containing protein [Penicillium paradoxum]
MNTKRKGTECDGTPKRKTTRHRATLACEECRARKRRCDRVTPACGGYVKRITVCIYASKIQAEAWRDRTGLEDLEKGEKTPTASEKHTLSIHATQRADDCKYNPDPGNI